MMSDALTETRVRQRLRTLVPKRVEPNEHTRYASVATVLRMDDNPQVLLIKRATVEGDRWSGHMAFPGGMREDEDDDLLTTAVRETREELALQLQPQQQFVARLDDVQAIARGKLVNLVIVPHVFLWHGPAELSPNEEVADVMWAPLAPMMSGRLDTTMPYRHEGRDLELPGYRVGPHVVWGLTHRMLQLLFAAIE